MVSALALGILLVRLQNPEQQLSPLNELQDDISYIGSATKVVFIPVYGGMNVLLDRDGAVARYDGATDLGLFANLRTGSFGLTSSCDIKVPMVVCPTAIFQRSYRSGLARTGKHSPGLTSGWVHNYDVRITLGSSKNKWEPFKLDFPNKSSESIEPVIDDLGVAPTSGRSTEQRTYTVALSPGEAINTYKEIRITWQKSKVTWIFTPHPTGELVLSTIYTPGPGAKHWLELDYDETRRLTKVRCPEPALDLISLSYDTAGLLQTVYDSGGIFRQYQFDTVSSKPVMYKVSALAKANEVAEESLRYSYDSTAGYPMLSGVYCFDKTNEKNQWPGSTIEYQNGQAVRIVGVSGVTQELNGKG